MKCSLNLNLSSSSKGNLSKKPEEASRTTMPCTHPSLNCSKILVVFYFCTQRQSLSLLLSDKSRDSWPQFYKHFTFDIWRKSLNLSRVKEANSKKTNKAKLLTKKGTLTTIQDHFSETYARWLETLSPRRRFKSSRTRQLKERTKSTCRKDN